MIEKYSDRIIMANPGTIITGKDQMLKGGISQPRNKGLFKMFNLIGLGEHAGSGVPDIFKAWKDAGLAEPIVDESFGGGMPDRTVLTLPMTGKALVSDAEIKHSAISVSIEVDRLMEILEFCNEPRTRNEIMEEFDYKSPSHFREDILKPMLAGGQLVMTIPDKPSSPKQKYLRGTMSQ